jgi:hypothetical protein
VISIYLTTCSVFVRRHGWLYVCLWQPALGLLFATQQNPDCVHRELRLLQLRLYAMRTMHNRNLPFNMCAVPVLALNLQKTAVLHVDSRYVAVRLGCVALLICSLTEDPGAAPENQRIVVQPPEYQS